MPDTKISGLTDGSPLQATDDIPVARAGTNRRVRIDLAAYATAAQGALADSAVQPADIDTLAELNAIVADATLIDTADSRLSDARTPTSHAASHATGGSDAIAAADIGAATAAQGALADTAQQPPAEGAFVDGDKTKLDGIEAGANVTDTAAVTAAGALMDSEVTNLAAVKAFDAADYATAAQGATADTATQPGDLATVATTGAYSDLSGTPTIPTTALPVAAVAVASSKTLALTDANTEQVVDSGSAVVLTLPTAAAVAFATGTKVSVLGIGAGTVTVTADTGVTLNGVSVGSGALSAQYSAAVLTKVGTDAWVINGDHGAVA